MRSRAQCIDSGPAGRSTAARKAGGRCVDHPGAAVAERGAELRGMSRPASISARSKRATACCPTFWPRPILASAMSGRTRPRGRPERPARPAETSLERVPMRPIRGALARRAMRGSRAPCPSDEASHASASAGMLGAPPAPVSTESAAQPSPARRQGNCAPARIARLGGGHRLAGFPGRWCSGGGGPAVPAVTSDGAGER